MNKIQLVPGRCKKMIWGGLYDHQCHNKATTTAGYCKIHDPEIRAKKIEAKQAEWNRQWDARQLAHEEQNKRDAEDARKLKAFGPLLESAKEVMNLLKKHGSSIVPHLMDSDENAGQRLRDAISEAEAKI